MLGQTAECDSRQLLWDSKRILEYLSTSPAACALIAMLIFIKYPLTDERFKEIRNETEARKLAEIDAHDERPEDLITPDHKV